MNGECHGYFNCLPSIEKCRNREWNNFDKWMQIEFSKIIEWDNEDWKERIVTINDL